MRDNGPHPMHVCSPPGGNKRAGIPDHSLTPLSLSRLRADIDAGYWLFNAEAQLLLAELDRREREAAQAIELLGLGEVDDAIRVLERREAAAPAEQTTLDMERSA